VPGIEVKDKRVNIRIGLFYSEIKQFVKFETYYKVDRKGKGPLKLHLQTKYVIIFMTFVIFLLYKIFIMHKLKKE